MDDRLLHEAFRFGYYLRGVEDTLARIEQKVDLLVSSMTPQERALYLAKLNDNAAKLNAAAIQAEASANKIDHLDKQGE